MNLLCGFIVVYPRPSFLGTYLESLVVIVAFIKGLKELLQVSQSTYNTLG